MDVAIFRADVAAAAAADDDDGGPVRGRERLRDVVNDVNDVNDDDDESMMISERLKVTSSRALLLLYITKKIGGLTLFLLSTSFFKSST